MNLKKKTITGLTWSGAAQVVKQFSQFIIVAILARLLSPDDFGLLGMATVFTYFISIFNEMGISSALIQKQDLSDIHYSSVFWLNIVTGILLTVVTIVIAPLISDFYDKPMLLNILKVISVSFIVASVGVVQQTILTQKMEFRKLAVIEISSLIVGGVIGIGCAYKGLGVWSLVFQLVAFTATNALLLWSFSEWRPKFLFSLNAIKDIFHFSMNMTGFTVVNYFSRNIDYLLIGKFLGAQALGYYTLAYKLMIYPLMNVSWVISKVMFPAFSQIQGNLQKVRDAYTRMIKAISLVTFPMMLVLFVITNEFIVIFFGGKWQPVIPLIRILCFCGIIQSINTTVGNIILSQGRAALQLKLGIIGTIVISLAIVVGLQWGIYGVALSYTIIYFLWSIIVQAITNNIIELKNTVFIKFLKNSAIVSMITFVIVIFGKYGYLNPLFRKEAVLFLTIIIWAFVYITLLVIFKEIYFKNNKMYLRVFNNTQVT